MTLAIGFNCKDGLVIAADSEFTSDVERMDGNKIWYLRFPKDSISPGLKVGIAGAGDVAFLKSAKDAIEAELSPDMSLDDAQATIQGVLSDVHHNHIYPYGQPHERDFLNIYFLIGVLANDGRRLLSTQLTSVANVDRYHSIGTGVELANFVVKRAGLGSVRTIDAVTAASQVFKYAREHVRDVGGRTRIIVLYDVGADAGFVQDETISRNEQFVETVDSAIRPVLLGGSESGVTSAEFLARLDRFRDQMLEARQIRKDIVVKVGTVGLRVGGSADVGFVHGTPAPLLASVQPPTPSDGSE